MCSTSQNHHARAPENRELRQLRDRGMPADRRERPEVGVTEGLRRSSRDALQDVARGVRAHLLGRGRDTGHRLAVLLDRLRDRRRRRLRDALAIDRSGATRTRPARSSSAPSCLPSGDAATPAAQRIVRAAIARSPNSRTPVADVGDRRASAHFDAERLELPARLGRQRLGEGRQHAWAGFDQQYARLARIDAAELARQRVPRDLGERAGELDARRSRADHGERQAGVARRRRRASLRPLRTPTRTRRRITNASSSVLSPGANGAQWSWPK